MHASRRKATLRAIEQIPQLAALFARRRAQLAGRVGLTDAQWRILEGIAGEHFMPSLFAREQDNTPGAVSKMIRHLLDKRLVRVSVSRRDGRQREYELTARGKQTIARLRRLRERAIADVWSDLPLDDLRAFTRLSQQLIERLRAYSEKDEQHR